MAGHPDSDDADDDVQDQDRSAELTGLGTVGIMALVGHALYSLTYGVVYASSSSSARAVPTLELWMVYSHLVGVIGALGVQVVFGGVFGLSRGLPAACDAMCSLYLSVAMCVTCLAAGCLRGGPQCSMFFAPAIWQTAASVMAIVWSWVMFIAALGIQTSKGGGGLTRIGLGGRGGLTAAAIVACVQPMVAGALQRECTGSGVRWDAVLAGLDQSNSTVGAVLLFAAVLVPHIGAVLFPSRAGMRAFFLALGTVLACMNAGIAHASPPLDDTAARGCILVLALLPWISMVRELREGRGHPRATATQAGPMYPPYIRIPRGRKHWQ